MGKFIFAVLALALGLVPLTLEAQENLTKLGSSGTGYSTWRGPDDPRFLQNCAAALRPKLLAHSKAAQLADQTCACTLRSGEQFAETLRKKRPRSVGFYMDNMREYCAAEIPAVRETLRALDRKEVASAQAKVRERHAQCGLAYQQRRAFAGSWPIAGFRLTGPCEFENAVIESNFQDFVKMGGRVALDCKADECSVPISHYHLPVDYAAAAARGLRGRAALDDYLVRTGKVARAEEKSRDRANQRELEKIKDCVYDPKAANPCPMQSSMSGASGQGDDQATSEQDSALALSALANRSDREPYVVRCLRTMTLEGELKGAACNCTYVRAVRQASGAELDMSGRTLKSNPYIASALMQCSTDLSRSAEDFREKWSD